MPRSLHVRLDESSAAALSVVRAGGLMDSEVVRTALLEAAAARRVRFALAEEARVLAADDADRDEMRRPRADGRAGARLAELTWFAGMSSACPLRVGAEVASSAARGTPSSCRRRSCSG